MFVSSRLARPWQICSPSYSECQGEDSQDPLRPSLHNIQLGSRWKEFFFKTKEKKDSRYHAVTDEGQQFPILLRIWEFCELGQDFIST